MTFSHQYLAEAIEALKLMDTGAIETMAELLVDLRSRQGRLFIIGVGGGAGHASHAVGDFRKIAGIEAYAPTDNAPEMTARTNDEGWDTVVTGWLKISRFSRNDMLFVFSVGGGDLERNISANLVHALELAREVGAKVIGIVGRDGGYTKRVADACVVVPTVNLEHITAHTESFQALIWHLLVSHPAVQMMGMKWESTQK